VHIATHLWYLLAILTLLQPLTALQLPAGGVEYGYQLYIDVENVTYVVLVHPDGAIEPRYEAHGSILLPYGLEVRGGITASYRSEVKEGRSSSVGSLVADLEVEGVPVNRSVTGFLDLAWRFKLNRTNYFLALSLVGQSVSSEESGSVSFTVSSEGNATLALVVARFSLAPYHKAKLSENITKALEALKALKAAGVDFIKLRRVEVSSVNGVEHVSVEVVVDLSRASAYLRGKGVPSEIVDSVEMALERNIYYVGEGALRADLRVQPGLKVYLNVTYVSEASGDVVRFNRLVSELGAQIVAYVLALILAVGSDVARAVGDASTAQQLTIMLTALSTGYAGYPALYTKPPSESYLALELRFRGAQGEFWVRASEGRLAYLYETGDPAIDARSALAELADTVASLVQAATLIAANLPGAHELVPRRVILVPADPKVHVEPSSAPLTRLKQVRITITEVEQKNVTKAEQEATPTPAVETVTTTITATTPTAVAETTTPSAVVERTEVMEKEVREATAPTAATTERQVALDYTVIALAIALTSLVVAVVALLRRR
jgi:hypothetical protein